VKTGKIDTSFSPETHYKWDYSSYHALQARMKHHRQSLYQAPCWTGRHFLKAALQFEVLPASLPSSYLPFSAVIPAIKPISAPSLIYPPPHTQPLEFIILSLHLLPRETNFPNTKMQVDPEVITTDDQVI
jgi:hypothetical protein